MSTIVVLKEADTLILGTDSRFMAHDYSGIASDAEQKIFEIVPDTFIATSGRKMACDFQVARAAELAVELDTTDIQTIGTALERESLPCLTGLVERLRLEPDGITRQAVSGESLLHGCMLVGRTTGGQLGYVSQSYRVQAGSIVKCETEAYFEARRKVTATSGAPLHIFLAAISPFAQDMATWIDPPEQVVARILEAMKQSAPTCGGPDQAVCLDNNGSHWISRPPRAALPLVGSLSAATISALVSIISPSISGGSITGASLLITGSGYTINIDSTHGIFLNKPGTGSLTISGAGGSNFIQMTDGSASNTVQPGLFTTNIGSIQASISSTGLSGALQLLNSSGVGVSLNSTGFVFVGTGGGLTTAFTGTLAAAIAAGKNVQGGIIVN